MGGAWRGGVEAGCTETAGGGEKMGERQGDEVGMERCSGGGEGNGRRKGKWSAGGMGFTLQEKM